MSTGVESDWYHHCPAIHLLHVLITHWRQHCARSVILIKVCIFSNYKFVLNTAVIPPNEPGLDLLDLSCSEYFQFQLLLPFVKIEQVYQKIEMTS